MRSTFLLATTMNLLVVFFLAGSITLAQETGDCQVVQSYPDGSYKVAIGGKTFLAITEQMEKNILKQHRDLLDAQKEIALKDSLLAKYDLTKAWYDTTIRQMKEYIAESQGVVDGYKNLVRDYKRLREPWLVLHGGLGASGASKNPAILMGLGLRRLHVWSFLQENNSGAFVGMQFRLF